MGIFRFCLAVLIMVVHHLLPNEVNGQLTVETFFVISGFFMAMILDKKYKEDIFGFYKARYLRLWPGFFITVIASILYSYLFNNGVVGRPDYFIYVQSFSEIKNFLQYTDWYVKIYYFFVQIFAIGIETVNFIDIDSNYKISFTTERHAIERIMPYFFNPVWALGMELSLYIVAPFIFKRKIVAVAFVIFGIIYKFYFKSGPMLSSFLPAEIGVFCLGFFAYKFYDKYKSRIDAISVKLQWGKMPCYFVIISIILFCYFHGYKTRAPYIGWLLIIAVLSPFMFSLTKESKLDNFMGKTSYYMYIRSVFGSWFQVLFSSNNFFLGVLGTFIFGALFVQFAEPLIDKIRFGKNYSKYHLEFKKQ